MTNCPISWCLVRENGPGGGHTPGERDREGAGTRPTAQTCPASAALARQQFPISNLRLKGQTPEPGGASGHEPFHLHLRSRDCSGAARTLPKGKEPFHKVPQQ